MKPARTRRQSKEGREPVIHPGAGAHEVIVDFLFEDGFLFISLRNTAAVCVFDVEVRFDCRIFGQPLAGGRNARREITALAMFRGTPLLAPGREITSFIDTAESYFARKQPLEVEARVTYTLSGTGRVMSLCRHDLGIYADIGYVTRRTFTPND